jgi:hypothetical protein
MKLKHHTGRTLRRGLATGMLLTLAGAVTAQEKKASAGLLNDWLREQQPAAAAWDVGGQLRARYDAKNGAGAFPNRDFIRSGQDNDNHYLLLRERLHVGYRPVPWFAAYVEGRDSSTTGDDRNPNSEADQVDLHQAFVTLGDPRAFPVTLKLGRQEMQYAEERLVGVTDWNNLRRVFDAAKLRFQNEHVWVDAFSGRVILPRDHHFNVPNDYDWFSGVYGGSRTLAPWQESEFYFLMHNVAPGSPTAVGTVGGAAARDIYTFGSRVKSLPGRLKGWDYTGELAVQFGSISSAAGWLEHHALALDLSAGYTWPDAFGSPRLGVGYTYGSGDSDPTDNQNETFDLLFGTNHKLYGFMDLWGLRNISSPRLQASLKPHKRVGLTADYHVIWLADNRDFFYSESAAARTLNGYGRNTQFGGFIGSELDLVAAVNLPCGTDLQVGYGHFFTGDYIRKSVSTVPANGGATDADWFYVQLRFNF